MTTLNISLDNLAVRCRPERLIGVDVRGSRAALRTAGASLELTAHGDGVVRVLYRPAKAWENEPTAYAAVEGRRRRPGWKHRRATATLTAATARVAYDADPVRLHFADANGTFLSESASGPFGYLDDGVAITWRVSRREAIYGLGQNAGVALNRVGQVRSMAAQHIGGVGGDIPIGFWLSSRGYGVVVDNPNVATFDLHRKGRIAFTARDGYLGYYVLWGPTMRDVLRRYAELTGRAPMPPKWFLGPMFCRVPGGRVPGYRSDRELVALGRRLRDRDVPADALVLDYQWDEWIGAFRWSRKRFPRAKWMIRELGKLGIQILVQLKPAVNLPAPTMDDVQRQGLAIRRRDGSIHTSNFHRGRSAFLDFFNERTRRWYGPRLSGPLADGVAGWWTDEGDWLGFESQTARDLDRSARGMRNLYNHQWARTIYEWQRRATRRRVVNITRTAWIGTQRYGLSIWSGDVGATWNDLADQVQMGLNMGLSGVPFWTTDSGGFFGKPTPELYVRWAQFAVFSPVTRFHGCHPREPWHFGRNAERIVRAGLQWRMRLMPYVYSTARQAHVQGLPMIRAMALEASGNRRLAGQAWPYFFGDSLLVRPITEPLSVIRRRGGRVVTDVPRGRWYDFWTGQIERDTSDRGGTLETHATLTRIPVYVRGPAVLVLAPPAESTAAQSWDHLTARVYVGDPKRAWHASTELYEDDGETYAYEKGRHLVTRLSARRQAGGAMTLKLDPNGRRPKPVPARRRWRLELIGVESITAVAVDGKEATVERNAEGWSADLGTHPTTKPLRVTVSW